VDLCLHSIIRLLGAVFNKNRKNLTLSIPNLIEFCKAASETKHVNQHDLRGRTGRRIVAVSVNRKVVLGISYLPQSTGPEPVSPNANLRCFAPSHSKLSRNRPCTPIRQLALSLDALGTGEELTKEKAATVIKKIMKLFTEGPRDNILIIADYRNFWFGV
jgi:hypothetical protein